MSTTHRAIQRTPTVCRVEAVPTPRPAPGEVLLAPEAVGLCGTDIQILRRMRPDPALIVGHEGFAHVVAVGEDVDEVAIGDRVMVNPTAPDNYDFLLGHNVPGLFQERVLIGRDGVTGGQLLRVPNTLDAVTATLVEPLAVVTYALQCLQRAGSEHLLVDGGGLIGLLAASRAPHLWGKDTHVVVVHHDPRVREWAQQVVRGTHLLDHEAANLDRLVPASTGVISAVYRDSTAPRIERLIALLGAKLLAVHTIGGVPTPAPVFEAGGVDLAASRSDNTGAPWPPHVHHGADIAFTGNRGVTNARLLRATHDLEHDQPSLRSLITHTSDLERAVGLINRIVDGNRADDDGRPIIRLVVRTAGAPLFDGGSQSTEG